MFDVAVIGAGVVGALAARSAVLGAGLNVRINAAGLKDRAAADALVAEPGVRHGHVNIIPAENSVHAHHGHVHRHADGTLHSHE